MVSHFSSFEGHYFKTCYWKTGRRKGGRGAQTFTYSESYEFYYYTSSSTPHINLWQHKNLWTILISSYCENDIKRQKLKLTGPLKHDSRFLTLFPLTWQFRPFLISPEPQKTSATKSDSCILETSAGFNTYCNWNSLNFCLNLRAEHTVTLVQALWVRSCQK